MPNPARWTAAITLTAAAVCGPLSGAAFATTTAAIGTATTTPTTMAAATTMPATPAASAGLYAPSALVLTVGHGPDAAEAAPERAVTLSCAPTASGTHPDPAAACAELRAFHGDFGLLVDRNRGEGAFCTKEYRPVVVTAAGVWQGKRVTFERTFANDCVKNAAGRSVFAF
ncbi:subtilase-type protease inhibitor [Streptomyces cavernae]|uniref:subtilase-type protease inhibitor n=1 Tax=Streptomyces cavernae TaxID=2259034 RepID=UPI000FEBFCD5|nr:subtilase-type protease inhibitor [Streptomyces cavernae]